MRETTLKWKISDADIDGVISEGLVPPKTKNNGHIGDSSGAEVTEIFSDLLNRNLIKDPFKDTNELDVQWIGERDWTYESSFDSHDVGVSSLSKDAKVYLVTEGLDTFTIIQVNGIVVAQTSNMFKGDVIDVTKPVKDGLNEIQIKFKSASREGRNLEAKYGKLHCSNGDPSRVYVRKAQYHYGWDWGPVAMSCGPYRPVKIVAIESSVDNAFDDVYIESTLSDDLKKADVSVHITLKQAEWNGSIYMKINGPDSKCVYETTYKKTSSSLPSVDGHEQVVISKQIAEPQLWWPTKLGNPNMYSFEIKLISSAEQVLATRTIKYGVRKAELVQESFSEDEDQKQESKEQEQEPQNDLPVAIPGASKRGKSFYFRINNVDMFITGSCWIPAHSFTTKLTRDDYKEWIKLAADGGHNMLRIWGGGIYEHKHFYDLCDELGILVWQDFMFACGIYPANVPSFLESVEDEVEYQLKRLRNYCSIVIYAGNNEDYQIAESKDLDYDPTDTSENYLDTKFPARQLYEVIFPKLLEKHVPKMAYIPGSPWGQTDESGNVNDQYTGDIHQWNVWHGTQEKYQDWYKLGGRFVSEYGMEAMPCKQTILDFVSEESQLYAQSRVVEHHNKALGFERRLGLYVMENVAVTGMDFGLDNWIYATQLVQAECTSSAIKQWRRQWNEPRKRAMGGSIVWQMNDCWPVTSWSVVDHYKRPKLAYYAIKREAAALTIGIQRYSVVDKAEKNIDFGDNALFDYRKKHIFVDIWVSDLPDRTAKSLDNLVLKIYIYSALDGELLEERHEKIHTVQANQTSEIVHRLPLGTNKDEVTDKIVYCRLELGDVCLAKSSDWPQPLKYLVLRDRGVSYKVEGQKIMLTTKKPVKCVYIVDNTNFCRFDDNGFDMFPNEEYVIESNDTLSKSISINYYQKNV